MDLQHGLWWLSIATEGAAFTSLVLRRITGRYRWFAAYLAFGVVRGISLHFAGNPNHSGRYAISWMITEPILLALLVLTTLEIVGKVPEHYQRFGSFGRRKLRHLLHIALALALISSVIESVNPQWSFSIRTLLLFLFTLHRITTSTLALYLILVAIFVSRVRVPFRRNLLIHSRLFACYLTIQTCIMLVAVAIGHGTPIVDNILTGSSSLLFVMWTVLLSRPGEALPARKTLSDAEIDANLMRERDLKKTAGRYSDRPLG